MNQKIMTALVAGIVGAGGVGGTYIATKETQPSTVVQVTQAAKRTWPSLSEVQRQQLVEALGDRFKNVRVHIVCGGTFCADLADDLNEVLEDVGARSTVEQPMFDLGRGLGISPDDERARHLAGSIKAASGGVVDASLYQADTKGEVVIGIARPPRSARQ